MIEYCFRSNWNSVFIPTLWLLFFVLF
jgi:hypothetical protein